MMRALVLAALVVSSWDDVALSNTTAQAAAVLSLGVNTVRHLLATGQLRGIRVGERRWIVPKASLIEFLGDSPEREEPPPIEGASPGDGSPISDNNDQPTRAGSS
jgi:excisionase family DNA binding protein